MKRAFTYFVLIAAVVLTAKSQALSCSCPTVGDPTKSQVELWFEASTTVFSGEAVKLEKVSGTQELIATIEVDRFWKGESDRFINVRTHISERSCGYNFHVGSSYIVYASGPAKTLTTGRCRGNTNLFDPLVKEQLTILERITAHKKNNL